MLQGCAQMALIFLVAYGVDLPSLDTGDDGGCRRGSRLRHGDRQRVLWRQAQTLFERR